MIVKSSKDARNIYTQMLVIAIVVLILRIAMIDIYNRDVEELSKVLGAILSTYWLSIPIILVSTTPSILLNRLIPYGKMSLTKLSLKIVLILGISGIISVALTSFDGWQEPYVADQFDLWILFLGSIVIVAVVSFSTDIFQYYIVSRRIIKDETRMRYKVQHQYTQLKQQLNPHFLFNSLNILNFLVENRETERASTFINKLAGVYRYLLSTEESEMVTLSEELDFVHLYIDLLKERFLADLLFEISISERCHSMRIVPCGIQLLIENAVKHNIVNKKSPLTIKIYDEDGYVVVSNNLQRRRTQVESLNLGLSNIINQYKNMTNDMVMVVENSSDFIVKLPLIR